MVVYVATDRRFNYSSISSLPSDALVPFLFDRLNLLLCPCVLILRLLPVFMFLCIARASVPYRFFAPYRIRASRPSALPRPVHHSRATLQCP